jgi:hypothetical protein
MALPMFPNFTCGEDCCVTWISTLLGGAKPLEVSVPLEDGHDSPSDTQLASVEFLQSLPPGISHDLSVAARTCFRNQHLSGSPMEECVTVDEDYIHRHYAVRYITVPKLGKSEFRVAFLSGDCDWEPEHGIHFLLVDTSILYCGSCSTLMYGKGWKRFITADGRDAQLARLNEHVTAIA